MRAAIAGCRSISCRSWRESADSFRQHAIVHPRFAEIMHQAGQCKIARGMAAPSEVACQAVDIDRDATTMLVGWTGRARRCFVPAHKSYVVCSGEFQG